MQQFIQTLDLIDDQRLINEYLETHRNVWPEITQGIRSVGISRMDIYLLGNRMVMLLEMPDDIDFDTAMQKLATLPRQAEWEDYVGRYQQCLPGSTSAGKWKKMTQIFSLPPAES